MILIIFIGVLIFYMMLILAAISVYYYIDKKRFDKYCEKTRREDEEDFLKMKRMSEVFELIEHIRKEEEKGIKHSDDYIIEEIHKIFL